MPAAGALVDKALDRKTPNAVWYAFRSHPRAVSLILPMRSWLPSVSKRRSTYSVSQRPSESLTCRIAASISSKLPLRCAGSLTASASPNRLTTCSATAVYFCLTECYKVFLKHISCRVRASEPPRRSIALCAKLGKRTFCAACNCCIISHRRLSAGRPISTGSHPPRLCSSPHQGTPLRPCQPPLLHSERDSPAHPPQTGLL